MMETMALMGALALVAFILDRGFCLMMDRL